MAKQARPFKGILSSDWSECLSPSGPFDFIAFNFPALAGQLNEIFLSYTGNRITLSEAGRRIEKLLPDPVTEEMMDDYLDRSFAVYRGVSELIEWCAGQDILFMLNTTGMIGYFQRVFAKGLLPGVPVLSANPLFRYPPRATDPATIIELNETPDKGRNTSAVVGNLRIASGRIVVMGDSGGDGPHFDWGRRQGAFLIASMAKTSLQSFCAEKKIAVDRLFGLTYAAGEKRDLEKEMRIDFQDLIPVIAEVICR